MNIAKAFVERNRLKNYISGLTTEINQTQTWHDKKTGERDWGSGKSLDSMLEEVINAKRILGEFNTAIDKANILKSRELLNRLESAKANLSTIDFALKRADVTTKEVSYLNGLEVIIERVVDVDIDKLKELQKFYKKEIKSLEDEIAVSNAETEVELSDDLRKFLESYDN